MVDWGTLAKEAESNPDDAVLLLFQHSSGPYDQASAFPISQLSSEDLDVLQRGILDPSTYDEEFASVKLKEDRTEKYPLSVLHQGKLDKLLKDYEFQFSDATLWASFWVNHGLHCWKGEY